MRRWSGVLVVIAIVPFLYACGGGATEAGDCSQAVRFGGDVYVEVGSTERTGEQQLGRAELARCDDVGRGAGIAFPDDAGELSVWSFPGYESGQVIGARGSDQTFRVFLVDGLSESDWLDLRSAFLEECRLDRAQCGSPLERQPPRP